jgi:hypothetical protein
MKVACLFLILLFVPLANELASGSEIYPFFRGVRAQGMGGAGVATVDDETSLFINPAGLGRVRGTYFALLNPELELNYDLNVALGNSLNFGVMQDPQGLLNLNAKYPDKHFHAKTQALPTFVTTNFGLGAYTNYSVDTDYTAATNIFHLDYRNDYGAMLGYCFRLFQGRFKIGIMGKLINRVEVSKDYPGTTTGLTLSQIASEGTGAGWDAGTLLTGPWKWLPTLGIAAHDIGKTKFNLGSGYFYKTGLTPQPQNQSIDAAFAIFPIYTNSIRSSWTIEYRDVQNPESVDVFRRLHEGVEIDFGDVLFLRGGMNQRYYTVGLELDFGHNQIQLATYGEEIGSGVNYREDRRFILQYDFRL